MGTGICKAQMKVNKGGLVVMIYSSQGHADKHINILTFLHVTASSWVLFQ